MLGESGVEKKLGSCGRTQSVLRLQKKRHGNDVEREGDFYEKLRRRNSRRGPRFFRRLWFWFVKIEVAPPRKRQMCSEI